MDYWEDAGFSGEEAEDGLQTVKRGTLAPECCCMGMKRSIEHLEMRRK